MACRSLHANLDVHDGAAIIPFPYQTKDPVVDPIVRLLLHPHRASRTPVALASNIATVIFVTLRGSAEGEGPRDKAGVIFSIAEAVFGVWGKGHTFFFFFKNFFRHCSCRSSSSAFLCVVSPSPASSFPALLSLLLSSSSEFFLCFCNVLLKHHTLAK